MLFAFKKFTNSYVTLARYSLTNKKIQFINLCESHNTNY